jgi:hypothetical protein
VNLYSNLRREKFEVGWREALRFWRQLEDFRDSWKLLKTELCG